MKKRLLGFVYWVLSGLLEKLEGLVSQLSAARLKTALDENTAIQKHLPYALGEKKIETYVEQSPFDPSHVISVQGKATGNKVMVDADLYGKELRPREGAKIIGFPGVKR